MTVIVWDGKTLATDAGAADETAMWKTIKAWRYGEVILSGAGPLASILAVRAWYMAGAVPNEFPSVQQTPQFCHFVVVTAEGLFRYEQSPHPIQHGFEPCAFGVGKDFAFGALAMGADARRAVEIANEHSPYCGMGVHTYEV